MDDEELIKKLRFEYDAWQAARQADIERHGFARDKDMSFYKFLLGRGFTPRQLKAQGIEK